LALAVGGGRGSRGVDPLPPTWNQMDTEGSFPLVLSSWL
jgi:hypothetical protein